MSQCWKCEYPGCDKIAEKWELQDVPIYSLKIHRRLDGGYDFIDEVDICGEHLNGLVPGLLEKSEI